MEWSGKILAECHHEFVSVLARDGDRLIETPLKICKKCNALRIGNTIDITANYIEFPLLTADPAGAEGRICYRADLDEVRYHNGVEWKSLIAPPFTGELIAQGELAAGASWVSAISGIHLGMSLITDVNLEVYDESAAVWCTGADIRTQNTYQVGLGNETRVRNNAGITSLANIYLVSPRDVVKNIVTVPATGAFKPNAGIWGYAVAAGFDLEYFDGTSWYALGTFTAASALGDGVNVRVWNPDTVAHDVSILYLQVRV